MMQKTHLLIGGSGFIGSILGRELVADGEKVISISLSSDGDAPGVISVTRDLYKEDCPSELIDQADVIYILIGQVHKNFDAEQEKTVLKKLAQVLSKSRAKILYFSTVLVYGQTETRASETTICHPIGAYAQFKQAAETICNETIAPDQLTILRLANVYGSNKNKGFIGLVMQKLSEQNGPLQINGDGRQSRDFIFIDNLVSAIISVAHKDNETGTVNIATGESHTLIETIELASNVSGRTVEYNVTNTAINEPKESIIDNSRLKKVYGFHDFTSLEAGLRMTLKRYSSFHGNAH